MDDRVLLITFKEMAICRSTTTYSLTRMMKLSSREAARACQRQKSNYIKLNQKLKARQITVDSTGSRRFRRCDLSPLLII